MDILEAIRAFLLTVVPSVHVGEDVPQEITTDFVWIMRSGELDSESLNCNEPFAALIDVEIVSKSIAQCRLLTETVKYACRQYTPYAIEFTENNVLRKVSSFDVANHDDSYMQHNTELDERLHIGSFLLTAYFDN